MKGYLERKDKRQELVKSLITHYKGFTGIKKDIINRYVVELNTNANAIKIYLFFIKKSRNDINRFNNKTHSKLASFSERLNNIIQAIRRDNEF